MNNKSSTLARAFVGLALSSAICLVTPPPAAAMTRSEKAAWVQANASGSWMDPSNTYIGVDVGPDGRFTIGAFQPAPWDLLYGWPGAPFTSFTTIRIDGLDYLYGYPVYSNAVFIQPPYDVDSLTNLSKWQVGDIIITQTLHITIGMSTGNPDTIKIQYDVMNNGPVSHQVGTRVLMDTEINYNDGAPFWIPGLTTPITTETELFPPNIPLYYQTFFGLNDPAHVAQGILGAYDATLPDRFVMASWPDMDNTNWNYVVTPGKVFGTVDWPDSAVALYWNPQTLAAGATRTYITYYGLGSIAGSASLGLSGPTQLKGFQIYWSPNPFTVTAYLTNNKQIPIAGDSLTLSFDVGSGLSLAPGESANHPLAAIAPGASAQTSWSVVPTAAGTWSYSVSDASSPPLSAQRSITVPQVWQCIPGTTRSCPTGLLGVCSQGQQTCSITDVWGACGATHQPSPEVCTDGLDNDCDGLVDGADPDCVVTCSSAVAADPYIWPPNHKFVPVTINGVRGPTGPANLVVLGVTEDEPVSSNKEPDATGVGTPTANVRSERLGNGDGGRVYTVRFSASISNGGSCQGSVAICVPHDMAHIPCTDDGQIYDATVPAK